jgi:hypothetical protein
MKNAVFWDVMPRGSCKNRNGGGTYHLHHQGDKNRRAINIIIANAVPRSPILVTLMMEALRRQVPEDGILRFCF